MKILVNLSGETSGRINWLSRSRMLGMAIKPLLDAQVVVDQLYLMTHNVPPLYSSGVRYMNEPTGRHPEFKYEEFAAIPIILSRGWGDCDDLAPWRVAELRCAGEKAKIRVQWRKQRSGRKMYHITVRRADGRIEDPSRILGMR